jgi:hypothetical protein
MKQIYEPVKENQRHIVIDTSQDPKINAKKIRRLLSLERKKQK